MFTVKYNHTPIQAIKYNNKKVNRSEVHYFDLPHVCLLIRWAMMRVSEMVMNITSMECSNLSRWDFLIERFVCCMTHKEKLRIQWPILEDPGAVSRVGRKGATKVFKYGRKSPWVPTLTELFPKIQADAGSWLGTKNALYYCAQSANSFFWVLFVSSYTTAIARFVHDQACESKSNFYFLLS